MLSTHDLTVQYPRRRAPALQALSLAVEAGRTMAVVGPSGAGKSTLLRAVAGLARPQSGDVRLDGVSLASLAPRERRIALVFQDDALFAHMSVRRNLEFALRAGGAGHRVVAMAEAFHVADHLDRRPRQLSGGERQRASIARALLSDPRVLLLDEPLAHLDPSLRRAVRDELTHVREYFSGASLYVTHDHAEAMSVATTLAVLIGGRIEDVGDPQRVYDAPGTIAVARFLGDRPMNLWDEGSISWGIRPEHVRIGEGDLRGVVTRRESTGADAYVRIDTLRGEIVARIPTTQLVGERDNVRLHFPPACIRRFDRVSGRAL